MQAFLCLQLYKERGEAKAVQIFPEYLDFIRSLEHKNLDEVFVELKERLKTVTTQG